MSEYWKSTPKYWCKHCSTYVKDTPFERRQHENTGKHQGNLRRFLRGIQNDHERNERDKQKAKDEIDRLNRTVGGTTTAATPAVPTTAAARQPSASSHSAGDRKRQWSQLAEMGIAVPEDFRAEMAMAGAWSTVSEPIPEDSVPADVLSHGVKKRKHDGSDDEGDVAPRRGWGSAVRSYPGSRTDDLDSLLNGTLAKIENSTMVGQKADDGMKPSAQEEQVSAMGKDGALHGEATGSMPTAQPGQKQGVAVEIKEENPGINQVVTVAGQPEAGSAPLFKKRKPKTRLP